MGYRLGVSKHSRRRPALTNLASLEVPRRVLLSTGLISFFLLRALQFLIAGRYPATYPDSGTYRVETDGWLDFSLISAQSRPTVITAFFALLPTDPARVFSQWMLSTAAWLLLIAGVTLLFTKLWVAFIALVATWTIGLSFFALQWDSTILSESLSITTLVFSLGFLFWWWRTRKSVWAYLAIASLGLAALNRPNLWITLVGALVVIGVTARAFQQRRSQTLTMLGLVLLFLGLSLFQQRLNDANFSGEGGLDRIGWSYASMLSDESPIAPALIPSLIRSGIPACMIPQKPFTSEEGPINIVVGLQNSCPDGVAWVNEEFLIWYAGFLLNNPTIALAALGDLVGPSTQALPYGFNSQVEPPQAMKDLFNLQSPGAAWSLVVVSLTAGVVSLIALRRRSVKPVTIGLIALELSLIASWGMGVLLQVWDIHRTIVTNVVGINLVSLLLIAAVLDEFSSKSEQE